MRTLTGLDNELLNKIHAPGIFIFSERYFLYEFLNDNNSQIFLTRVSSDQMHIRVTHSGVTEGNINALFERYAHYVFAGVKGLPPLAEIKKVFSESMFAEVLVYFRKH